jgi:hypothetical protein
MFVHGLYLKDDTLYFRMSVEVADYELISPKMNYHTTTFSYFSEECVKVSCWASVGLCPQAFLSCGKNKGEEGLAGRTYHVTDITVVVNFESVGEHLRILNTQTLAHLNCCTCSTLRVCS